MNAKSSFAELERYEREEPQEYERMAMSPESEAAFEEWTKRLVPTMEREPF